MKHVPNALTILRMLVTPVVLVLLFKGTLVAHIWALGLFVFASISDYVDGKLARSYEVHSRLGQFLDPLADKVLVLGTFIALIFITPDIVPWWAVLLIALRDAFVTALRAWAESRGYSLRTLPIAKAKTTAQLVFLIGMLLLLVVEKLPGSLGKAGFWVLGSPIPFVVLLIVVVITVATGAIYAMNMEYNNVPAEPDA